MSANGGMVVRSAKTRLRIAILLIADIVCLLVNLTILPNVKAENTATPTPLFPSQLPSNLPVISAANAQSLKEVARFCAGNADNCGYVFAWSPDSRQFAVSNSTGVDIFDIYRLHQTPKHFSIPDGQVEQFSPDWTLLASIGKDGSVILWNVETTQREFAIPLPNLNVEALKFSPNGQYLALFPSDNSIRLWDARTLQEVRVWRGEQGGTDLLSSFSPEGSLIAITSATALPSSIQLWDIKTGQVVSELKIEGLAPIISHLAFKTDGTLLAITSSANTSVWNTKTHAKLFTLNMTFNYDWALGAVFSPDGKLLAVSGRQRIYVWDVTTQKQTTLIDGLGLDGVSVQFGTDGSWLFSTDQSDTDFKPHVRLWDTTSGKKLSDFVNEQSPVLSSDGTMFATSEVDGSVVIRAIQ